MCIGLVPDVQQAIVYVYDDLMHTREMSHMCSIEMAVCVTNGCNVQAYAAQCRYNAVNILKNIHKRHAIARPLGRGMVCLLWIQHLIDILSSFCNHFSNIFIYWTAL